MPFFGNSPHFCNPDGYVCSCRVPYSSPCLVVVQVGQIAKISALLAGIHKLSSKHPAKFHIVAAASPMPVWPSRTSAPVVTGAGLNCSLGAGTSHSVCDACTCDSKHKRSLAAT